MRLCNSRISEEHLVSYQTSQRKWLIIKMLYDNPHVQGIIVAISKGGSDKEFVIKSYVDASFYTSRDDSGSQSRCILKVGAIS